jgi:hypothetical protein
MLQLLLRRYDNYTEVVNIDPIVRDFEMIESTQKGAIRIFKTQMEIEYFEGPEGGDLFPATGRSYQQAGKFCEPKREPIYIRRSQRNTFYRESDSIDLDASEGQMNFSFNMGS